LPLELAGALAAQPSSCAPLAVEEDFQLVKDPFLPASRDAVDTSPRSIASQQIAGSIGRFITRARRRFFADCCPKARRRAVGRVH
jgi:hypothetical protein